MGCSHLIIDGFNVIHALENLKSLLMNGKMDVACSKLVEMAHCIHDNQPNLRTTVVFDGNGPQIDVQHPSPDQFTFSVIFSPNDSSADSVIRRIVTNSKAPQLTCIATQDLLLANSLAHLKPHVLSHSDLLELYQRAQKLQCAAITSTHKTATKGWSNSFEDFF